MLPKSVLSTFCYILWYALLVVCNINTKRVLDCFPYPCTVAASNLGLGLFYIVPVWLSGIRPKPRVTRSHVRALLPIAVFHAVGVAMTLVSIQAGPVALTNTVKTSEPVFSTVLWAMQKTFEPMWVNVSLVPVIGGVMLACAPASNENMLQYCIVMAVVANVSFAVRAILSKTQKMHATQKDHMTPANVFALIIILSFCIMVPVALIMEGTMLSGGLERAYELSGDKYNFIRQVLTAGLTYYLCNEAAYLVRGFQTSKNALYTNAIGDTAKRAIVIIASVFFFSGDLITKSIMFRVGSCVALLGHLTFSISRAHLAVTRKTKSPKRRGSSSNDMLKPRKLNFDKSPDLKRGGLGDREEKTINSSEDVNLQGKTRRRSLSFDKFRRRRKKSEDHSVVSGTRSMHESNGSFWRRRKKSEDTIDIIGGMRSIQESSKSVQTPRPRTRSFDGFRRRRSRGRAEI